MKQRINQLKGDGYKIIYLDECLMTTKTLHTSDYTNKNIKHRIPLVQVSQPAHALLFAISEEEGVEHYRIYKNSVDQYKFAGFLDELYIANKHHKIAVLLDNLTAHKTTSVLQKMAELEIEHIYNVPYQPDYNPIEATFSKIKRKKIKLTKEIKPEKETEYE